MIVMTTALISKQQPIDGEERTAREGEDVRVWGNRIVQENGMTARKIHPEDIINHWLNEVVLEIAPAPGVPMWTGFPSTPSVELTSPGTSPLIAPSKSEWESLKSRIVPVSVIVAAFACSTHTKDSTAKNIIPKTKSRFIAHLRFYCLLDTCLFDI